MLMMLASFLSFAQHGSFQRKHLWMGQGRSQQQQRGDDGLDAYRYPPIAGEYRIEGLMMSRAALYDCAFVSSELCAKVSCASL